MQSMGDHPRDLDPRVVSMRAFDTRPREQAEWHAHPFHEFCLVAESPTNIGKSDRWIAARRDTLIHLPRGERHCFRNDGRQTPRFWVLHFVVSSKERRFEFLGQRGSQAGVWHLSEEQAIAFKTYFLRILREHSEPRVLHLEAEASWLGLLFVQIQRWTMNRGPTLPIHVQPSPELMHMWQLVSECVATPGTLGRRLRREVKNYDSLRRAFKREFGATPREIMRRLRLQHAKNLLLETSLTMKEIASRLGYTRQHEFARTFRRQAGQSPSSWRSSPAF